MCIDEWHHCYADGWKGIIVDEAFRHPAKMARGLALKIYAHAFDQGWLERGDTVVDPFGGIAGTGVYAGAFGVRWIGCELESKFVELAQQNIDLWMRMGLHRAGDCTIIQGDSRYLKARLTVEGLLGANVVVSSPPFSHPGEQPVASQSRLMAEGGYEGFKSPAKMAAGQTAGNLESMPAGQPPSLLVSSPPYAGIATGAGGLNTKPGTDGQQSGRSAAAPSQDTDQRYGSSDGQLAVMREWDVAAVVGSPPFINSDLKAGNGSAATGKASRSDGTSGGRAKGDYHHGESVQNLGNMAAGEIAAVVSSPPYEAGADGVIKKGKFRDPVAFAEGMAGRSGGGNNHARSPEAALRQLERDSEAIYGNTDGNIGNQSGDTFWEAAADIVGQCFQLLRPGGVAIWVTKDFVRKGQRVPFGDQWQALCESRGFVLACRHHAMLVERGGTQGGLFGDDKQLQVSRKSFFRRMAESKGSPAIDWEDVICVQKPLS